MRIAILTYLCCLLALPFVLSGVRTEVRRQARAMVLTGVPESSRTHIRLSHEEWKGAIRDNGKEILHNNVYYDVISVEESSDFVAVCCVRDDAETNIGKAISLLTDRQMQSDARVPSVMAPLLVFAGAEQCVTVCYYPDCSEMPGCFAHREHQRELSVLQQTATPPPRS